MSKGDGPGNEDWPLMARVMRVMKQCEQDRLETVREGGREDKGDGTVSQRSDGEVQRGRACCRELLEQLHRVLPCMGPS